MEGHRLAEFLTSDSLTAQGYCEFEGFTGHHPGQIKVTVICESRAVEYAK